MFNSEFFEMSYKYARSEGLTRWRSLGFAWWVESLEMQASLLDSMVASNGRPKLRLVEKVEKVEKV